MIIYSFSPTSLYQDTLFCKIHSSKFQNTNALNSNNLVYDYMESQGYWCKLISKEDKLGSDSVYESMVQFRRKYIPGITKAVDNLTILFYVDNTLCKVTTRIYFNSNQYQDCLANYNLLKNSCINHFQKHTYGPYKESDKTGGEQLGEYSNFWNDTSPSKKFNGVSIVYEIRYKEEGDWQKGIHKTGEIDGYSIEISETNTSDTKISDETYGCDPI